MTSRDFCLWLRGFLEISGSNLDSLNKDQIGTIATKLESVFKQETTLSRLTDSNILKESVTTEKSSISNTTVGLPALFFGPETILKA